MRIREGEVRASADTTFVTSSRDLDLSTNGVDRKQTRLSNNF